MSDIIDAEIVDDHTPSTALVPATHTAADMTLYGTDDPELIIEKATRQAAALDRVLRSKGLIAVLRTKRGPQEHVKVEGWTTLGALVGVFPVTVWTKRLVDDDGAFVGFDARVEARTKDGGVVGGAEARCTRSEDNWKDRDEYALQSMAQTRATSKALRMPLGFIVQLAGYDPTPAEEMPQEPAQRASQPRQDRGPYPNSDTRRQRANAPSEPPRRSSSGPSEQQRKMMFAVGKAIGLDSDEDRHGFYSAVVGRSVGSADELSGGRGGETSRVIDALKDVEQGRASLGFDPQSGPFPDYGEPDYEPGEEPYR